MSAPKSLLLVGCGQMGSALLSRWQATPPAGISKFYVVEPGTSTPHQASTHVVTQLSELDASLQLDVVVLAVKPQSLEAVLPAYRDRFGAKPLYLSIAAGKTLSFFAKHLGEQAQVVRAMPNTPAMIGKGMSVLCASQTLPASARHIATGLMQAVGEVEWVEEEKLMHAVTALSGSGPAYMFLFLDALTKAGIAAGLDAKLAKKLSIETCIGSCELAQHSLDSFEQLRSRVTSKGGTTEAALAVLLEGEGFNRLIASAIKAAAQRSEELN